MTWDVSCSGRYKLIDAYRDEAKRYVMKRLKGKEQATVIDDRGFESKIGG